jgi:hypothetical protein
MLRGWLLRSRKTARTSVRRAVSRHMYRGGAPFSAAITGDWTTARVASRWLYRRWVEDAFRRALGGGASD